MSFATRLETKKHHSQAGVPLLPLKDWCMLQRNLSKYDPSRERNQCACQNVKVGMEPLAQTESICIIRSRPNSTTASYPQRPIL